MFFVMNSPKSAGKRIAGQSDEAGRGNFEKIGASGPPLP
jgi:hypothetical protein